MTEIGSIFWKSREFSFLRFTNTEVFDSIDHVVARITQRVRGLLSENPIQLPLSGGES